MVESVYIPAGEQWKYK